MLVKTSNLLDQTLDWAVAKALGSYAIYTSSPREYLSGLNEDDLWNTLCSCTPGAIDASIMTQAEMIDYGVANWRFPPRSTDWVQGGPIIEREGITSGPYHGPDGKVIEGCYQAYIGWDPVEYKSLFQVDGPTPLVAAMRCFVACKLGEEVDVPDELCTQEAPVNQQRPRG